MCFCISVDLKPSTQILSGALKKKKKSITSKRKQFFKFWYIPRKEQMQLIETDLNTYDAISI